MNRRTSSRIRTAAVTAAFLAEMPLITAAAAKLPPPEKALSLAVNVSAFLTAGSFFPERQTAAAAEAPAEIVQPETDKHGFSVDDSNMLSYGSPLIPNSSDEERRVDDSADAGPKPYPESLESRDGKITLTHYGHYDGEDYIDLDIAGQVRNVTDIPNEKLLAESRLAPDFEIERSGEPQILIMHTHTTESYEPYERDFYDSSFNSRTTDERMNMVAVGNAIAEQLENAGIGVIHDKTMHDYPSYNDSYDRSRVTVQKILDENPSIKIVLDIHRDAIERADGERIAPVSEINGRNAAQIMIISGCDDGTMNMPDYMKNFRFACMLEQQLESSYPGLTRPVLFDYRKYNQDMTTGSLLIEVGGHANSIEQAVYSGELIGKALSECFT